MKRITFKAPLAGAIRRGEKTETRRLISPQPHLQCRQLHPWAWRDDGFIDCWVPNKDMMKPLNTKRAFKAHTANEEGYYRPAYRPGNILGVAEPWKTSNAYDHLSGSELVRLGSKDLIRYEADGPYDYPFSTGRYRQARFLPDAFVRTRIRIMGVQAQRVQEITEEDAEREGVKAGGRFPMSARGAFSDLWDTLHGKPTKNAKGKIVPASPWSSNPWVWRYQFELVTNTNK